MASEFDDPLDDPTRNQSDTANFLNKAEFFLGSEGASGPGGNPATRVIRRKSAGLGGEAGGEGEWKRSHKQSLKYEEIRKTIWGHYNKGKPLIIHYRDGLGLETIRKIKIIEITTNPGKNKVLAKAYCYLRGEERTFRLDRIFEVEIVD